MFTFNPSNVQRDSSNDINRRGEINDKRTIQQNLEGPVHFAFQAPPGGRQLQTGHGEVWLSHAAGNNAHADITDSRMRQNQQQQQADFHAAYASAAMAERRLLAANKGTAHRLGSNYGNMAQIPRNFGTTDNLFNPSNAASFLPLNDQRMNSTLGFPSNKMNMHHFLVGGYGAFPTHSFGLSGSQQEVMLMHSDGNMNQYAMLPGISPFLNNNHGSANFYSANNHLIGGGANDVNAFTVSKDQSTSFGPAAFGKFMKTTKKKKTKDPDKPKRPLSSYNIFFKHERQKILKMVENGEWVDGIVDTKSKDCVDLKDDSSKSRDEDNPSAEQTDSEVRSNFDSTTVKQPHGKISFENLAKLIGQRWKTLPEEDLAEFQALADEDMKRYKNEIEVWLTNKQENEEKERIHSQSNISDISKVGPNPNYLNFKASMLEPQSGLGVPFETFITDDNYQKSFPQDSQSYGLSHYPVPYNINLHQLTQTPFHHQLNRFSVDNMNMLFQGNPYGVATSRNGIISSEPIAKKQRLDSTPVRDFNREF